MLVTLGRLCFREVYHHQHSTTPWTVLSYYLDWNLPVVQPWLQKLMEYAELKQLPLLFGFDSNAHSELYGPDTNDRGKKFEEFILQHNLKVENRGETPSFHAFRRGQGIGSCIDVTLSKGLVPLVEWRVHDHMYNGSDHHTIMWSLPLIMQKPPLIRPWRSAKWDVFRKTMEKYDFNTPDNFTTKKVDKFLDRLYKHIHTALTEACPLREVKASPIEIEWYGKNQTRLQNRTKRKYAAYKKNTNSQKRKAFLRARRVYLRS